MIGLKKKALKTAALIAFILICMVVSTVKSEKNRVVSDITGIVMTPIEKAFTAVNNLLDYGGSYFADMDELKKENAELKSKIIIMNEQLSESSSLRSENERLRTLVDLKEKNKNYEMVAATVTAIDPSGWYSYFIIDRGTDDGLSLNAVVMDSGGVIGSIKNIGSTWAKVVTITSPGTACGAEVTRTGDTGIIEGDSALDGLCRMTSIGKETSITPGDYIVTSGSGDIYPPGLTIGRIKEISDGEISKTAVIEPTGNVKTPKEVMVICGTYPVNYEEQD